MFGLGVWEIAVVLAVALVVLGPKRLPHVAKQLGRTLRDFRRAASDFQVSLEQEADADERRQRWAALEAAQPVDSDKSSDKSPESRFDPTDDLAERDE